MVVEKKKYIIELPENTHWIQWIMESTKDHHPYMDYKQVEDLTLYTEPDFEQVRDEAYEDGYKTAKVQCNIQAEKDLREVGERHYQKGLSDAWEAARKIASDKVGLKYSIFGQHFTVEILNTHSASEALEEIRAHEQAQKEKEEQEKEQSVTAEKVMRQYLDAFCRGRSCTECPLYTQDFTCGRGYHFLTAEPVSDEEVRRAYAKVLQNEGKV